jgi:hypothetical protein
MKRPSENTLNLLFEYEVGGGQSYYEKKLSRFTWPGGHSGPTIGIGIDTAYYNAKEIADIFKFLPEDQIHLIQAASGRTGQRGKRYTAELKKAGIVVTWQHAVEIFEELTWPKFSKAAERAFPGLTELCDDAYGAIVSLVFNRGTAMAGDSRREMRNIRSLVGDQEYKKIAKEIRSMKRIWEGKDLDGLLKRREAEALLIESCI